MPTPLSNKSRFSTVKLYTQQYYQEITSMRIALVKKIRLKKKKQKVEQDIKLCFEKNQEEALPSVF